MVEEIEGVVNDVPVPKLDPPEEAAYQLRVAVPLEAVAPKLKVPAPQREAGVEEAMVGTALTVATTAVRLAGEQLPKIEVT